MSVSPFWPLQGEVGAYRIAGRSLKEWQDRLGLPLEATYPWDLLQVNAVIHDALTDWSDAEAVQMGEGARLIVGEGTRILPGVYVEGTVLIGADCKIGPNC